MSLNLNFQPKAKLILQLGDQLIRSESIALLELIKNSYDANASKVSIKMSKVETPLQGEIIIEDDGNGMDAEIIKNVWMQPGNDHKLSQVDILAKLKTKNRLPIGEKGIGRFGVHKLGFEIEIISKMSNKKEIQLKINWKDFEKDVLLDKIKVFFAETNSPKIFSNGKTGTKIIIRKLRSVWTRPGVRELYRSVNSLSSPFESLDSFSVLFDIDKSDWITGLISFKEVKKHALYSASVTIKGNLIKELKYNFIPWDTMSKLNPRPVSYEDIRMVEKVLNDATNKKEWVDLNLNEYNIGTVKFEILIFDRESKILSLGVSDKKGFTDYLNTNGGIRVYRSGIRVYDYGEPGNDWLNLDFNRVNQPGKTISNNITIGAVYLDRTTSSSLIEKTNREGFVENAAYFKFVSAIGFALDRILTERNLDKERVRKFYSPLAINQPVIGNLRILQDKITSKIPKGEFQDDLLTTIKSIEKDYETISEIYTRSSSAGLSLAIVIHEVIHMVTELGVAINETTNDKYIRSLVATLQKTVSDYAGVIKQSPKLKENLIELIDQSLSNIQFRLKAHKVEIVAGYKKKLNINTAVKCSSNLIISTLINLIDNSIWWGEYAQVKKKKIYLDITEDHPGFLSIVMADNGPGFSIPAEEAVKPFVSNKPGGMGLGLHLANEVMTGQKGKIIFLDKREYKLPSEFINGAKILLAFKK